MKCYKIVRKIQDGYISCFIDGILRKTYYKNKYTKANKALFNRGYGLCCFKTIQTAKEFQRGCYYWSDSEVWEAEGENQLPFGQKNKRRFYITNLGLRTIKIFFNLLDLDEYTEKEDYTKKGWPKGTIMFEKVKLIKKV